MQVAIDLNSRLVAGVINQEQYETLKARCLEKFQASPPPDTGSSIGNGNASSSSSPWVENLTASLPVNQVEWSLFVKPADSSHIACIQARAVLYIVDIISRTSIKVTHDISRTSSTL
jgi:hypothetical protein